MITALFIACVLTGADGSPIASRPVAVTPAQSIAFDLTDASADYSDLETTVCESADLIAERGAE